MERAVAARQRRIGEVGRLRSPSSRASLLRDVRITGRSFVLDHFDPEVVEVGFGVTRQAQGDGEGAVRGCLAEKDDARERRERRVCPELKLLAADRVAHDDAPRSRRARVRPFDQHRDPDQVVGLDADRRRANRGHREVEELGQRSCRVPRSFRRSTLSLTTRFDGRLSGAELVEVGAVLDRAPCPLASVRDTIVILADRSLPSDS